MSSKNRKWFLFVNLLFNLTLSNNLLAIDNTDIKHESGNIPDSDTPTFKDKIDQNNALFDNKGEKSLEQIIASEKLLINQITQEEIFNEEKFIEQLSIEEYSKLEIIADELYLKKLTSRSNAINRLAPSPIELSIAAIYNNDANAKSHAIDLLNQGKQHSQHLSKNELSSLLNSTELLVNENLTLLKLAQVKKAASHLADKSLDNNKTSKEKTLQQQQSLDKLIKMHDFATYLTDEHLHFEKIKNSEVNFSSYIDKPRFLNNLVTSSSKNILHRKNRLEKLAALKSTVTDLHIEKIEQLSDVSKQLKNKGDKLEKLSSLKDLRVELIAGSDNLLDTSQANSSSLESNKPIIDDNKQSILTQDISAYTSNKIVHIEDYGEQNYVLLSPSTSTIPVNSKKVTEEKTITEDITFGVKIGEKQGPNPAEIQEITGEIAPILDSVDLDPEATELLLVDSKMNNKEEVITTVIAFNESKKLIYAPVDTIKNWGIEGPYPDSVDFEGQSLIPLHDMHNIVANLDRGSLRLDLSAPTDAFSHQIINFNDQKRMAPAYSDLGMFLNYDTLYTKSETSRALTNVLLNPVLFSNFGYVSNRFRYLSDVADNDSKFTRLESYFQKDFPNRLTSLRIGDSISPAGNWGRSTVFTGIQYGTNFSTQPEFLTTPLPSLFSETSAPSTVDIYINDRLARNVNVNPGPFEIQNIPPLNGNGQIQFVIRDELGRERIITTDFYANSALLRPGVTDYSINLGVERENVGRANANYGSALGIMNYRRGITNTLTLAGRGEFSRDTKNFGLSVNYTLGTKGTIQASTALSNNTVDTAALWRLGYRYSKDQFNFSSSYQKSGADFRFIGQNASVNLLSQLTLSTGYNTQDYGSFAFSHVKQRLSTNNRSVNSISYAKTFANKYSLDLYASKAQDNLSIADTQFGISFSTSLANGAGFSSSYSKTGDRSRINNTYQKSSRELFAPSYRINTTSISGAPTAADIDVSTRTQYFDVDARINQRNDVFAHQVGAYGSFALLKGGYWGFTRDISDSFAVVKVADFENVGIYQQNRFIGRTNDRGYLIAPDLTPYLENIVRFDAIDVPLDTTFKSDETQIVPYSKSGVLVDFKIDKSVSYSFTAVDERGRLLKLGTNIRIDDEHTSIVGYDGLVFVQVPEHVSKLDFAYGRNGCEIELPKNIKPHDLTGIISTDKLICKFK